MNERLAYVPEFSTTSLSSSPSAYGDNISASTAISIRYDLRSGSSSISAKCELNTDDQLCVWAWLCCAII